MILNRKVPAALATTGLLIDTVRSCRGGRLLSLKMATLLSGFTPAGLSEGVTKVIVRVSHTGPPGPGSVRFDRVEQSSTGEDMMRCEAMQQDFARIRQDDSTLDIPRWCSSVRELASDAQQTLGRTDGNEDGREQARLLDRVDRLQSRCPLAHPEGPSKWLDALRRRLEGLRDR
jgi:hypothetical protein